LQLEKREYFLKWICGKDSRVASLWRPNGNHINDVFLVFQEVDQAKQVPKNMMDGACQLSKATT